MNTTALMKKRAAQSLAVLCLLLLAPGLAIAQEESPVAEGARVYGNMCGRCHNPRSPLERTDRQWVVVANHMRVRANMTGDQLRAVLAFLQATNTDPAAATPLGAAPAAPGPVGIRTGPPSTDPAIVVQGTLLVQAKACLGCHVIGGAGGQVGPSMNGIIRRRDADFIRRKLADPTFNNSTSMMPNFGLTSEQIEALVAYLATLNGQ